MRHSKKLLLFSCALLSFASIVCDEKSGKEKVPIVTTSPITNITTTTASAGGDVTEDGGADVTARGVCWSSESPFPTIADDHTVDGAGTGSYSSSITNLSAITTYCVRSYATNSIGTSYGPPIIFTTDPNIVSPVVRTTAITNITLNSVLAGGNVTYHGYSAVSSRGVCWSTFHNPTKANNFTVDGSGTGPFTSVISGFSPNTTYYVKAYATNSIGTGYGEEVSFNYPITTLTVTTSLITNVTPTSANASGNVLADGGQTVNARGVCWNTDPNPTIANSKTIDGSGIGPYTSSITGLTTNTTYYVKAYATNTAGTSYGDQISFTTPSTFTDSRDDHVYLTIQIGTQTWMAENLDYRTSDSSWYYNNDSARYHEYGRLYTWNRAMIAAPPGWHLPTDAEWTILVNYLGGWGVAGSKLKEVGLAHWLSPNSDATNESGFTALGGGFCMLPNPPGKTFYEIQKFGFWWSSSEYDLENARSKHLGNDYGGMDPSYYPKIFGLSVRCVKD